ncbi:helix-hairpin-helix domain-containing protein [Clostridia bacterium OttesenSCG-928-O13]|nr:helix-hairpin-helix domain-containing protein [Clostridia bacterium OttesenSCG-928-O13]
MNTGLTKRGSAWETRNSLWMIAAFIPFFNYAAYFYIGQTAKQKKWTICGVLYLLVYVLVIQNYAVYALLKSASPSIRYSDVASVTFWIAFGSIVVSAIQAILSRKEYLIRRDIVLDGIPAAKTAHRHKVLADFPPQYRDSDYHRRGTSWAVINSLWMILLGLYGMISLVTLLLGMSRILYILLNMFSFFNGIIFAAAAYAFIGIVGRNKKWILFAFLSLLLLTVTNWLNLNVEYFVYNQLGSGNPLGAPIRMTIYMINAAALVAVFAHLLSLRKDYLMRRDVILQLKGGEQAAFVQNIVSQYGENGQAVNGGNKAAMAPPPASPPQAGTLQAALPGFVTGGQSGGASPMPNMATASVPGTQPMGAGAVSGFAAGASAPGMAPFPATSAPPVAPGTQPVPQAAPAAVAAHGAASLEIPPVPGPGQDADRLDLNHCTEQQLSQLPGVGVVLAKRAVALRAQKNGFVTVEEFITVLDIKPHFAAQIIPTVRVEPMRPPAGGGGRILDI